MILAQALGELGLKHARVDIDTIDEDDSENNMRWQIVGAVLVSVQFNWFYPYSFLSKVTLTIKCKSLENESLYIENNSAHFAW